MFRSTLSIKSKEDMPLARWIDVFMERYGMGFEEFKNLPIPTFYSLAEIIVKESEENKKKIKPKK